ncbi:uncharacterized protein LOC124675679 isoform X2 [Lolium rigidum]|nr:uncharacterized protein LOC124675679 isoform X2 [Lolium rigidum]
MPAESAVAARRFRSIPLSSVVSLLALCTNSPALAATRNPSRPWFGSPPARFRAAAPPTGSSSSTSALTSSPSSILPSRPPRCCGGSTVWCGGASAPTWAGRRFGGRLGRPLLFVYLDYFIGYRQLRLQFVKFR